MARLGRSYPVHRAVWPTSYLGAASVEYDAAGAGFVSTAAASSGSWAHTIAGNGVVTIISAYGGAVSGITATAKVGSTSMTLLDTETYTDGTYYWYEYAFGLIGGPTGSQEISFTTSSTANISACSISFTNANSFGTVAQASSTTPGSGFSMSVSSAGGQMVAQAFGQTVNGGSGHGFTAYNQTSTYIITQGGAGSTVHPAFVMGYAAGASSVTFSVTGYTGSAPHAAVGVAVPVLPPMAGSVPLIPPV